MSVMGSLTCPWYLVVWKTTENEKTHDAARPLVCLGLLYTLSDAKMLVSDYTDVLVREIPREVKVRNYNGTPLRYAEAELPGRWV